ncbi:putative Methyltransferase domain-containing protein [Seiridium unicorne]|uniref:Methyltransferase domain-containing protein n=1 Tax=Seiridium unicorne TaxID=138068 RepID=A0ABR2V2J0_9PEZI
MNPRTVDSYDLDASILGEPARELLREYSGVSDNDINDHVEAIRAKAFKIFLDLSMMTTHVYPEVIQRLKQDEKFLDLGCCFGQEIRKFIFDGAPSSNTYGCDLWSELLDIGYEHFWDEDRSQATFISADVFDNTYPLTQSARRMNIIYTGAFFHLFSLEEQEKVVLRVVQLLVPQPGSLVIGRQSGSEVAGESSRSGVKSRRKPFGRMIRAGRNCENALVKGQAPGGRWRQTWIPQSLPCLRQKESRPNFETG